MPLQGAAARHVAMCAFGAWVLVAVCAWSLRFGACVLVPLQGAAARCVAVCVLWSLGAGAAVCGRVPFRACVAALQSAAAVCCKQNLFAIRDLCWRI